VAGGSAHTAVPPLIFTPVVWVAREVVQPLTTSPSATAPTARAIDIRLRSLKLMT